MKVSIIGAVLGAAMLSALPSRAVEAEAADAGEDVIPLEGVNPLVQPSTRTMVTGALTGSKSGTTFKAYFTPWEMTDTAYAPIWSPLKLGLETTEDGPINTRTTASLSTGYDPFHPLSSRGKATYGGPCDTSAALAVLGAAHPADVTRAKLVLAGAKGKKAELERKLSEAESARAHQALAKSARESELETVKASLATLTALRTSVEQLADQAEVDVGPLGGDLTARRDRLANELATADAQLDAAKTTEAEAREAVRRNEATITAEEAHLKAMVQRSTKVIERFRIGCQWRELRSTIIPSVSVTGFVRTHPVARAEGDNTKPWGGGGAQLQLLWRPHERGEITAWGTYARTRPSGAPDAKLSHNVGGSLQSSWTVLRFLDDCTFASDHETDCLQQDDDYIASGFIPGLSLGASFQINRCFGGVNCEKSRTFSFSATPYVSVRASTKLNVRFSLPLSRHDTAGDDDENEVTPTISLAGIVSGG